MPLPFSISFLYLSSPSIYSICLPFICHSSFVLILWNQLSPSFCSFTLCLSSQIISHISSILNCFYYLLSFLRFTLLYFIFLGFLCLPFLLLPNSVYCPVLLCSSFTLISSPSILSLLSLLSFHSLLPFIRPLLVYGPYIKLHPIH
jgi:hypothetical protein